MARRGGGKEPDAVSAPASRGDQGVEVVPVGIELLDEAEFPPPVPLLQLPFALQSHADVIEALKVDKLMDGILRCKAGSDAEAMLADPFH